MERKSGFTRTLSWFETADLREAAACLESAREVLAGRVVAEQPAEPKPRRKRRVNGGEAAEESLANA